MSASLVSRVSERRLSPGPTVLEFRFLGIAGRFLSPGGVAIPTEKQQGARWKRGETCFTSRASRCFLTVPSELPTPNSLSPPLAQVWAASRCQLASLQLVSCHFVCWSLSRVRLFATHGLQASSVCGILQARILACHSLLQGIFPIQGLNSVSCIAGRFVTIWATFC